LRRPVDVARSIPRLPGGRLPPLLRDTTFRRFLTGQTISLLGDQVSLLAVPLVGVLVLHANAAQMGYLTAAGLAPSLLFSLVAGAQVDRRGHRRAVMLAADLGRAGLLATIPLAYVLGSLSLAHLYVVAFAGGTLDVLFFVSYSTLFVSIVPADQYMQGNSLLSGSRSLMQIAGQSVAGLLVAVATAPGALALDAVSFLASAAALARIHPAEPATQAATRGHLISGVRFIRHSPTVRAALGATATVNYFNFVFVAVFILYATATLHVPPTQLGLVFGLGAIGGLVGASATTWIGRRIGIGPTFMLGCILFPAPLLLVPLAAGSHALVLGCLLLAEFGSALGVLILDISIGSIFATVIPDHLRARVSGAYRTVNYGIRPLGALTGGALGSTIGLRATLWIAAIGGLTGILWLIGSPLPKLKTLTSEDQERGAGR